MKSTTRVVGATPSAVSGRRALGGVGRRPEALDVDAVADDDGRDRELGVGRAEQPLLVGDEVDDDTVAPGLRVAAAGRGSLVKRWSGLRAIRSQ